MAIPRKFEMKPIDEEPLSQTQRREKQVMYNFQTDIELQLRADSNEEKCQSFDNAMEELISQKTTGQRRAMIIQLLKTECEREEKVSQERWEKNEPEMVQKICGRICQVLPVTQSASKERQIYASTDGNRYDRTTIRDDNNRRRWRCDCDRCLLRRCHQEENTAVTG